MEAGGWKGAPELKDSGVTHTAGKAFTPMTTQAQMSPARTAAVTALEGLKPNAARSPQQLKNKILPQPQLLPSTRGTAIYKTAAVFHYTLSGLEHILRTLVLTSLF